MARSGFVSWSEFVQGTNAALHQVFQTIDTDHDGVVTRQDLRLALQPSTALLELLEPLELSAEPLESSSAHADAIEHVLSSIDGAVGYRVSFGEFAAFVLGVGRAKLLRSRPAVCFGIQAPPSKPYRISGLF